MQVLSKLLIFFRLFFEGSYRWTGEEEREDGTLIIKYSIRFKMIDRANPISWFSEHPEEVNKFTREDRDNIRRKVILFQHSQGEDIRIQNINFSRKNKYIILPILIGVSICAYDFTMFASHRMAYFFGFLMPGGAVSFPLVYFIANIIQEVYGYKRIRQLLIVILITQITILGLSCLTLLFQPSDELPLAIRHLFQVIAPDLTPEQQWNIFSGFYEYVLGQNVRNVIVNSFAITLGLFANAYVFARIKNATKGQLLWLRSIGATCVGEFIFTLIFVFGAFTEQVSQASMWTMQFDLFSFKVLYECISIFLTYFLCWLIKKIEGIEVFDFTTSLNPFRFWDVHYDANAYKEIK
jgi:hypothetical protein